MKTSFRSLLFLMGILALSGNVLAQTEDNKLGIGLHAGITRLNDDFKNYYFESSNVEKLGALSLSYWLHPKLDLSFIASGGDVSTYNNTRASGFNSVTTTIRMFDLTVNIKPFPATWPVRPYFIAGLGYIYADNWLSRSQGGLTMPLGVGLRYSINDNFQIDGNIRQNATTLDELDGTERGDYNDQILIPSLGLIYNFGSKPIDDRYG
jgi:hypothetical protein